jgi:hypothetical protein
MLFAVACASDVGPGPDGDPNDPNDPKNPDSKPTPTSIQGKYEVTSKYDLRNSPDIPDAVAQALGPLSNLENDPAGALISLLPENDVSEMLDNGLAKGIINGIIRDQLFDANPAIGDVASYVDLAASIVTDFEVISELDIKKPNSAGNATATHTLTAISFDQDGQKIVVQASDILGSVASARNVSLQVDFNARKLDVGDHAFNLPRGEFAVDAYHTALEQKYGITDLGATLTSIIDCREVGQAVWDAVGFTIGDVQVLSPSQVEGFCTTALTQLPKLIDQQIRNLKFAELRHTGGQASITVRSKEVKAIKGTWDSEIGFNGNGLSMPSEFQAKPN